MKAICVQNWDTNGDGELSEAEAAAVTTLGEVFKDNRNITLFNEFQYFTGLTSIGDYAFYGCSELISLVIPNSVTYIGYLAFNGCNNLPFITIPKSVSDIDDYAFNGGFSINVENSTPFAHQRLSLGDNGARFTSLLAVRRPTRQPTIGRNSWRLWRLALIISPLHSPMLRSSHYALLTGTLIMTTILAMPRQLR